MKWHVCMVVDASFVYDVEADSEEEAKEIAMQEAHRPGAADLDIGEILEACEAWEAKETA